MRDNASSILLLAILVVCVAVIAGHSSANASEQSFTQLLQREQELRKPVVFLRLKGGYGLVGFIGEPRSAMLTDIGDDYLCLDTGDCTPFAAVLSIKFAQ